MSKSDIPKGYDARHFSLEINPRRPIFWGGKKEVKAMNFFLCTIPKASQKTGCYLIFQGHPKYMYIKATFSFWSVWPADASILNSVYFFYLKTEESITQLAIISKKCHGYFSIAHTNFSKKLGLFGALNSAKVVRCLKVRIATLK